MFFDIVIVNRSYCVKPSGSRLQAFAFDLIMFKDKWLNKILNC